MVMLFEPLPRAPIFLLRHPELTRAGQFSMVPRRALVLWKLSSGFTASTGKSLPFNVPEAIVARHMDIEVLGISCITNLAAGITDKPIDHSEVMAIGEEVRVQFTELLSRVITKLD